MLKVRHGSVRHLILCYLQYTREIPDMSVEIARQTRACWMRIRGYLRERYNQPKIALILKIRIIKSEATEALFSMDVVREPFARNTTLNSAPYTTGSCFVSSGHSAPNHRMTSYNRALEIPGCESIETTLRTRGPLLEGTLIRISGGRLPKRIVFGNLEGAVRRGRSGKEKQWTDCVQSDIRAFGVAGDLKATALKAEVWVETAAEGERRFMAVWRK